MTLTVLLLNELLLVKFADFFLLHKTSSIFKNAINKMYIHDQSILLTVLPFLIMVIEVS